MKIEEFISVNSFSDRDNKSACKMYAKKNLSKEEWIKELENKFVFKSLKNDNITKETFKKNK